jgi:xanthine dehydrogenase YagS FAD-binding subunit
MRPFVYHRPGTIEDALQLAAGRHGSADGSTQFMAGGTTILDLMKLDVMWPHDLVDINDLSAKYAFIHGDERGLQLGALTRMGDVAAHPTVRRDYPIIAQSLDLAASPQIRNMASLGGNVLQRTRCTYFRDPSWKACNKRTPGSGCAALDGVNRRHAILGVSDQCIATYPGDFAVTLAALDAQVEIAGPRGRRTLPFAQLHRLPADTPHMETVLRPDELITQFSVPAGPWTRRSLFLKIRDRESYEFALTSAAVALDLDGDTVRAARIALGGVATVPWRAREAEQALQGRTLDEAAAVAAAQAAFAKAQTRAGNRFKPELGRQTLVRALLEAKMLRA